MKFWSFIKSKLEESKKLMLLIVIDSKGSSPGRKGFKMAVCEDGELKGSVGGGVMEYDIVELGKAMLSLGRSGPVLKKQIHKTNAGDNHSGMICSGEQTIVLLGLNELHKSTVNQIINNIDNNEAGVLELSPKGIVFHPEEKLAEAVYSSIKSESEWEFKQLVGYKNRICIIGAGHVGLALSKLMKDLDFSVEIYDDRKDLNTLQNNIYVDKKHIIDYKQIAEVVPQGENVYVVIMTFGHKSDQDVLASLINKKFNYLGLMGSKAKVAKIYKTIGYNPDEESAPKVFSPIGISIKSKTPMEIAVSVAAEIISVKNA